MPVPGLVIAPTLMSLQPVGVDKPEPMPLALTLQEKLLNVKLPLVSEPVVGMLPAWPRNGATIVTAAVSNDLEKRIF